MRVSRRASKNSHDAGSSLPGTSRSPTVKPPAEKRVSPAEALVAWLAVLSWLCLIFWFSHQPSLTTNLGVWDFFLRKAAHMVEFGALTFLIWRALRQHWLADRATLSLAGLAALAYALSDEYHQSFIVGRTATIRDVGFDLAGILITLALVLAWRRRP